jgi:hypothetical protein
MRISGNQGCSYTDAHLLLLQMQQLPSLDSSPRIATSQRLEHARIASSACIHESVFAGQFSS